MSRRVIWQQCYDHAWNLHIGFPVNRDFGWSVHACASLMEDGGAFILELSVNGQTKDINLANVCVPIPVGPISVQVCVANLNLAGGNVAFDLVVKACLDVSLFGIHFNPPCFTLTSQHISIHVLTQPHLATLALETVPAAPVYASFTADLTESEIANALAQPAAKA